MRCVASHRSVQALFAKEEVDTETDGVKEVSLGTAVGKTSHVRAYHASLPAHSPSTRLTASDCARVRGLFLPRGQQRGDPGSAKTGKSYPY
eukprot:196821-Pleurochrysis_carterae.AAC.2